MVSVFPEILARSRYIVSLKCQVLSQVSLSFFVGLSGFFSVRLRLFFWLLEKILFSRNCLHR